MTAPGSPSAMHRVFSKLFCTVSDLSTDPIQLVFPVKVHLKASFFGEFIKPVFEGEHHISSDGIGAGLTHIVQLKSICKFCNI